MRDATPIDPMITLSTCAAWRWAATGKVHALDCALRSEDRGRRRAVEAARRVERVDAKELVEEAAGDAEHRGAAVLALGVELEGLDLGVRVAHPRLAADVARRAVADVGVALIVEEEVARLHHARGEHDLQPARGGHRLERGDQAGRGRLAVSD